MKKLVIFDLDGTLLDTSDGIIKCHQHAHTFMGKTPPALEVLQGVIGAPLFDTYKMTFGFSCDDARKAVDAYRLRYAEKGIHEAYVYPGISELLEKLEKDGLALMVATLKKEDFAKNMLKEFGIAKYFTKIYGVDEKDKKRKVDLLRQCIATAEVDVKDAVLVGDSHYDYEGACACNMDFVGVKYGFGFHDKDQNPEVHLCDDTQKVYETIKSL